MPLCDSRPTEASGTRIQQSVSGSGTQILIVKVCPSDPKGKPPGHRGFAARPGAREERATRALLTRAPCCRQLSEPIFAVQPRPPGGAGLFPQNDCGGFAGTVGLPDPSSSCSIRVDGRRCHAESESPCRQQAEYGAVGRSGWCMPARGAS